MSNNSSEWWDSAAGRMLSAKDDRIRVREYATAGRILCESEGPVLEIGCCFGGFAPYVPSWRSYLGIDISPKAIAIAHARYPHFCYLFMDFKTLLANTSQPFVSICMFQVLEHYENPVEVVIELMRLCTKELIMTVPRGLPSPEVRRADGHVVGWTDEDHFRREFSKCGTMIFWPGDENHICVSMRHV